MTGRTDRGGGGEPSSDSYAGEISPLRWWTKKAARRAVAALPRSRKSEHAVGGQPPRVRVLMYHRFGTRHRDPYTVEPLDFRRQMHWLAQRDLVISVGQLDQYLRGVYVPRDGSVIISIDDGSRSVHRHAAPIMHEYRLPSVAHVVAGMVGQPSKSPVIPEDFMSWSEIEEIRGMGVAIGSHGMDHRSLGTLDPAALTWQAETSATLIERNLGERPSVFAYPFGTPAHVSLNARVAVQAAGYRHAFTATHGATTSMTDPLLIPRIKIEAGEDLDRFISACRGGLDRWHLVDRSLAVRERWRQRRLESSRV